MTRYRIEGNRSEQLERELQRGDDGAVDHEIHWLDLLIVLGKNKKLVIGAPILTGVIALIFSLFMTPIFTSIAKITTLVCSKVAP